MYQRALLYLACLIAGFGIANIPTSSVINEGIAGFFEVIGGFMVIIFALAILYLGIRSLFNKTV